MKKSINIIINGENLNIKCEESEEQDLVESGFLLNKMINYYRDAGKGRLAVSMAALEVTVKAVKARHALEKLKLNIKE